MIKRDLTWTPFIFFLYRDIKRFYKVKIQTVLTPLINQSLYLIIFGVSLGQVIHISDQFSYLQFIIPGLLSLVAMNQPFQNGSSSIFTMKITGEIIDIKSTALSTQHIIGGVALSGLLRGVIVSFLTLFLGEVFHFIYQGTWFPVPSFLWLTLFITLSGLTFSMLGLSIGMFSKSFDQIGAISGFVVVPLIYLGGVFFDLNKLSLFWQKISLINPLFYFVNGIRYSCLGVSDVPVVHCLLFSLGSLVFAYFMAYWSISRGSFHRSS